LVTFLFQRPKKHRMQKTFIVYLIFIFVPLINWSQKPVSISFEGTIVGFLEKDRLLGATVYMMQNDKTISKSISDNYGNYQISGIINPLEPIDILISKPGFVPKKVLFDMSTLKLSRANSTTLKVLEDLTIELFNQKPGVDLSFARIGYAEKFTWDQQAFIAKPDEKQKKDLDEKVKKAYESAKNTSTTSQYDTKAKQAIAKKEYQKAAAYYDTALVLVPRDSTMMARKGEVLKLWDEQKKEEAKKKEIENLIASADDLFKNEKLDESEAKYVEAQKLVPDNSHIKSQLQKITEKRNKNLEAQKNKAEYDKVIKEAESLVAKKNYAEAIKKYESALNFDSTKKPVVDAEISKIRKNLSDSELEEIVKKDLKAAQDLLSKGKLDESLKGYQATESNISKFSDQNLVDKYSKELKDGLQKVQDKKDSEDQAYRAQLAKAIENFNKGKSFYNVAKNILNSDPMKSKQSQPEVVDLKDRIQKMEEYFVEKQNAYVLVTKKENDEAIDRLSKLLARNVFTQRIAQSEERQQIQKSLDSLKALKISNVPTVVPNATATNVAPTTNNLQAPGQLVVGKDVQQVFNDMLDKTERRKATPFENQQKAKDAYDFEKYFASTLENARQEEEKLRQNDFDNTKNVKSRELGRQQVVLQLEEENRKLKAEIAAEDRDVQAKKEQEKNDLLINAWKDQTDHKIYLEKVALAQQSEEQRNAIERNKEQGDLLVRERIEQDLGRQESQDKSIERVLLDRFRMDSISKAEQETRGYGIQKKLDYVPEKIYTPNNLADENGIPFEKNKMTEKIYEIRNDREEVIMVVIRRVVVDKNGFGIVYEQKTNDSGQTFHTKNGLPVPDFIWYNESTGENVLSKN